MRVQKNLHIQKVVQIFMVENVQNIFMEHDLYLTL